MARSKARVATRRPGTVSTVLGPVVVEYVDKVRNRRGKKLNAIGLADFIERKIQVRDGLHPTAEFHTLCHEWSHFVLYDAGLNNLLPEQKIEAICDAFATALVASSQ